MTSAIARDQCAPAAIALTPPLAEPLIRTRKTHSSGLPDWNALRSILRVWVCVETIDRRTHERTLLGGDILIGVNAAGMANEKFWSTMGSHLNDAMRHLDYIGLDLFPDVFHPIPHESLADSTQFLLTTARERSAATGFPSKLPFHITETGWPTGRDRTEATQANVLHLVADAVLSSGHDVSAYEFGISNANAALPRSTVQGSLVSSPSTGG